MNLISFIDSFVHVAMCLKADTALKMIDRGLVVPAN